MSSSWMNVVNINSITQAGRLIRSRSSNFSKTKYSTLAAEKHIRADIQDQLDKIKETGTWKAERVITSKQDNYISVQGSRDKVLNFCANNYLGLASHPDVVQAGIDALKSHAAGLSSSRFICGTNDMHIDLERKISEFHRREDTILYASCFDANAGLFEVLLGHDDEVYSDQLNHASIIDGVRLCRARKHRYKHLDMKDLEHHLSQSHNKHNRKLIVTDGVFSMDGNMAPLREICDLADEYNAIIMVDECHATGFIGDTGRGTEEYLDLPKGRVTLINSTLGKAMGGAAGGYTTGPKEIVDLLRQKSRPYLFSNALPPAVVACASKVYDMLMESSDLPHKVFHNTRIFRDRMAAAGFKLGGHKDHPICPVMLGDEKLAHDFADDMLDHGIYVIGFSYPVVPMHTARIRVQISACHTEEDVEKAIAAFTEVGKKLNVIN